MGDYLQTFEQRRLSRLEYDLLGKRNPICFKRENNSYHCNIEKCLQNYKLKDLLGQGAYGTVYSACKDHKCNIAIKILTLNVPIPDVNCNIRNRRTNPENCNYITDEDFEKEVAQFEKISKLNVGPKFLGWWKCSDVYNKHFGKITAGFIAMERWGISVDEWNYEFEPTKRQKNMLAKKLARVLTILDKHNLIHTDLHSGNVVVKYLKNGDPYKVGIIDLGDVCSRKTAVEYNIPQSNFVYWARILKEL